MFVYLISSRFWSDLANELQVKEQINHELQIKEMIRVCTRAYFDKWDAPISKTNLVKFLYKATREVSQDNPLKNCIPFYWYIHGPYSPPLLDIIEQLSKDGVLKHNGKGYLANYTRLCDHDEHFDEVQKKIRDINYNSSGVMEEFHLDKDSYGFYISFKSRFTGMLHNYFYDQNTRFTYKDLEDILHQTIGEFPTDILYSQFGNEHLDFIEVVVELAKKDLPEKAKKSIEQTSEKVFETFANGVRILEHDSYFDSETEKWKIEFKDSVNELRQNIDRLYELAHSLGLKKTLVTFQTLIDEILSLRSRGELVKILFVPGKNDAKLDYGDIGTEFFYNKNDKEFEDLLRNFEKSHNAHVDYSTDKALESTNYRLIAS